MNDSLTNTTKTLDQISQMSSVELREFLEIEQATGYPSLSEQRKCFAYEYIKEFDHRASAKKVGFEPGSGMRLLREPLLGRFITELKAAQNIRMEIDADFVKSMWLDALPKLAGKEPVSKMGANGIQSTGLHFDASALVSALKDLGTMTDVYKKGSLPQQQGNQIQIVGGPAEGELPDDAPNGPDGKGEKD